MKISLGLLREYLRLRLETAERMLGDDINDDMADHLKRDVKGLTLGSPPDEVMESEETALFHAIKEYFLQEAEGAEAPSGENKTSDGDAGSEPAANASPSAPAGFYTPFDMDRDHSATWYKSPGQAAGTGGDPFRNEDPNTYLGFHPPASGGGDGGTQLAPQIWQLSAGSNTSQVLGANAKPSSSGVDSGDGSEETQASGAEGDEAEEQEQD